MPREIISKPCRQRRQHVIVTCPWCGRKIWLEKRTACSCRCGALHRWTGDYLYHVPKVR
ncbi:MAG: hypothetical protein ACOX5Z_05595 [Desulfobulbus sp.]